MRALPGKREIWYEQGARTEQQLSGTLKMSGPSEQGPMKSPSSHLPGAVPCARAKTKGTEITGRSPSPLTH